jgi:hypothetical protein
MKGGYLIEKFRRKGQGEGAGTMDLAVHPVFDCFSINPAKYVRMGASYIYSSKVG